jgi:hypothetical protein
MSGAPACSTGLGGLAVGSGPKQRIDGAAFVHGLVGVGDLLEWQIEVEHLAGLDLPVPDPAEQVGQASADRRRLPLRVGS